MPGPRASPREEALSSPERLRRRAEFLRCYQRGRRRHGAFVILYAAAQEPRLEHARLGITVSRKVGGAVVRNRLKRRIREIYRRWPRRRSLPAVDLLFHVRPAAREASFPALEADLLRLLEGQLDRRRRAG